MMKKITRREFIKLGAAGLSALALTRLKTASAYLPEFPQGEKLGRAFYTVDVFSKPDINSTVVNPNGLPIYQDNVVNIYREVIGANGLYGYRSKIWYETDGGYVYAPTVQPVKNEINQPLSDLPTYGAQPGFWAEVTVPYVDLKLINERPLSPLLIDLLNNNQSPRFYYSQVLWIDGISTGDFGEPVYRVVEKHGSPGDIFWADARAFKPVTPDDLAPIDPDVHDKSIVVNVTRQSLSCYEGKKEVFYTVVSTGARFNADGQKVEAWATPVGDNHVVNRKYVSLHMAGGAENKASGWENFAVGYSSIFASGGVAFHSTYWHNAWGSTMSHGCVNMKPEESKFIYRWTQPNAPYEEGKVEQQGYDGTKVRVVE